MADREWNDGQPIYRQLRDLVAAMILDGGLMEGEPLPSVRQVAAEYRINPITAMQAYQRLVDERVVEAKRGRGMFVNAGARQVLLHRERTRFLTEQWPRTLATIHRLGLAVQTLLDGKAMEITGPECGAEAGGPVHPQPATDR